MGSGGTAHPNGAWWSYRCYIAICVSWRKFRWHKSKGCNQDFLIEMAVGLGEKTVVNCCNQNYCNGTTDAENLVILHVAVWNRWYWMYEFSFGWLYEGLKGWRCWAAWRYASVAIEVYKRWRSVSWDLFILSITFSTTIFFSTLIQIAVLFSVFILCFNTHTHIHTDILIRRHLSPIHLPPSINHVPSHIQSCSHTPLPSSYY